MSRDAQAMDLAPRARFAAKALLAFAGQVREYCQSYPYRLEGLREPERGQALAAFKLNAVTLVRMLRRLREAARGTAAMRVMNFEQFEAQEAAVREALACMADAEARRLRS